MHTHAGFGVNDPLDSQLSATRIAFNKTFFTNLIWDASKPFRVASELTFRNTYYLTLPDNDGVGVQG